MQKIIEHIGKSNPEICKKYNISCSKAFIPRMQGWFKIQIVYQFNILYNGKREMIISIMQSLEKINTS